jgi:hypothetical protein
VKGKISRIANNGTYVGGGTYGNASYWISADGTENEEFQIYRSLYFNGEKYTEGTDIKVGDEVIVYGALMNYKGNTPETVANENWLYSLNGKTDGGSGGGGGGDTPSGTSVSFSTNSDAQVWAADSDGTYGSGFSATVQGVKVAYFKHTSSSNPIAPNANHVRVYKNSALSISSAEGKKIKKIVIGCAPNAGTTSYCFDMAGLEGGANAACDKDALTITWSGSASKVVLHANKAGCLCEREYIPFSARSCSGSSRWGLSPARRIPSSRIRSSSLPVMSFPAGKAASSWRCTPPGSGPSRAMRTGSRLLRTRAGATAKPSHCSMPPIPKRTPARRISASWPKGRP